MCYLDLYDMRHLAMLQPLSVPFVSRKPPQYFTFWVLLQRSFILIIREPFKKSVLIRTGTNLTQNTFHIYSFYTVLMGFITSVVFWKLENSQGIFTLL